MVQIAVWPTANVYDRLFESMKDYLRAWLIPCCNHVNFGRKVILQSWSQFDLPTNL